MNKRNFLLYSLAVIFQGVHAADEIHWTITGQTSVTFDWRGTAAENAIFYGASPGIYDHTVIAAAPNPHPSSPGFFWEAHLTDLQENTLHYYRIGDTLEEHTFKTPPKRGNSDFKVYAEGDIGSTLNSQRIADVQALVADKARFVLMVGDLTYGDSSGLLRVDRHFNDVMAWSQQTAYMPAWGNHDWDASKSKIAQLNEYEGRFALPNSMTSPGAENAIGNGPGEDWYWFDYGNVRFIAYPEPFSSATWTDWHLQAQALMDEAQGDNDIDFIVTFGHQPAYSSGHHAGSTTLKAVLDALGDFHSKYVLNINGHSHNYERTFSQHGVVHVTAGTGGATLETEGSCLWKICKQPEWSAYRAMHHGIVRLHFKQTGVDGAFICGPEESDKNDIHCTPGETVDSFTISNLIFAPSADAPIKRGSPANNYGLSTNLGVKSEILQEPVAPVEENFLMTFTVSGVGAREIISTSRRHDDRRIRGVGAREIISAKLRLYSVDSSDRGGDFYWVADTSWTESGVNWDNAPVAEATAFASLGSINKGQWYEVDVKALIAGDGVYSLRVKSPSHNWAAYRSKETAGFAPQLVLTMQ